MMTFNCFYKRNYTILILTKVKTLKIPNYQYNIVDYGVFIPILFHVIYKILPIGLQY